MKYLKFVSLVFVLFMLIGGFDYKFKVKLHPTPQHVVYR